MRCMHLKINRVIRVPIPYVVTTMVNVHLIKRKRKYKYISASYVA